MTESDFVAAKLLPAGTLAPDFALNATPDQILRLNELRGRPVILSRVRRSGGSLQRDSS
jgi:hypothetical protein